MAKRKYLITISESDSKRLLLSFKGSKTVSIAVTAAIILVIMIATYLLTSLTPIKYSIPGYPTEESRKKAIAAISRADSLETVINRWNFQMENIRRIMEGREPLPLDSISVEKQDLDVSDRARALYTKSDSILRSEIIDREKFDIEKIHTGAANSIEGMLFFTPVQGVITQQFDQKISHPYLEIGAKEGSIVHSILDGTVIAAYWDEVTGNTVVTQHNNDIISVFKHTEKLLKKNGDAVRAGDPIAITGEKDRQTNGAHLYFELWYKGRQVNPELYIKF